MPSRHDLPNLPLHAVYLYSVPAAEGFVDCFLYACATPEFVVVRGADRSDVLVLSEDDFVQWQLDAFKLGGPVDRTAQQVSASVDAILLLASQDAELAARLAPVAPDLPPAPEVP